MRGNLGQADDGARQPRSIPAHAGEPPHLPLPVPRLRVYPRACGGTEGGRARQALERGLSPRMRGNPAPRALSTVSGGSIPAHAGEPLACTQYESLHWVYPRACGGTASTRHGISCRSGLSPRMRGNHSRDMDVVRFHGSIPAHAGEPYRYRVAADSLWVYPRACGGTPQERIRPYLGGGLSPRMRGNQSIACPNSCRQGSIPAHAGEPERAPLLPRGSVVYPRACGGT